MKSFAFWRYFPFTAMLLVAALLMVDVWRAFAAPSSQTRVVAATAMVGTPTDTFTVTPTPMVPQSANTNGIILLALILLVVILSGMALGWRLTATTPKEPAVGEAAGASRKNAEWTRARRRKIG